jgi:hypothetical protein
MMFEKVFQRFSVEMIFCIGFAIIFLGAMIPLGILTALGRTGVNAGEYDLWFVTICTIPTSAYGLILFTKALIKKFG